MSTSTSEEHRELINTIKANRHDGGFAAAHT